MQVVLRGKLISRQKFSSSRAGSQRPRTTVPSSKQTAYGTRHSTQADDEPPASPGEIGQSATTTFPSSPFYGSLAPQSATETYQAIFAAAMRRGGAGRWSGHFPLITAVRRLHVVQLPATVPPASSIFR